VVGQASSDCDDEFGVQGAYRTEGSEVIRYAIEPSGGIFWNLVDLSAPGRLHGGLHDTILSCKKRG
jgi:hypothetical protein